MTIKNIVLEDSVLEFVKILTGIGQVLTDTTVVVALFALILIYKFASERLKKSDENSKEVSAALKEVSVQLERVATITEVQAEDIKGVEHKIGHIETEIKELWREKQDKID